MTKLEAMREVLEDIQTPKLMAQITKLDPSQARSAIAALVRQIGRDLTQDNNGLLNDHFVALTDEYNKLRELPDGKYGRTF